MATKPSSAGAKVGTAILRTVAALLVSAMMLAIPAFAPIALEPPFAGQWEASDADGGHMNLSITGRAAGPYAIYWTSESMASCGGEAGIRYGTSRRHTWNDALIVADVHLDCLASGAKAGSYLALRFQPITGRLAMIDDTGTVTYWQRPNELHATPPKLSLRVNSSLDWVEGFYEAGHKVWVVVTEPDGVTPRGSVTTVSEPQDSMRGETGFESQTTGFPWLDAKGHRMESPPDIRINDWVFAWADNGAGSQVQVGEIRGLVNVATDSITGTVRVPWATEPVWVQCLDWGSGQLHPYENFEFGLLEPNGSDQYTCSWAGQWNIQGAQNVGVGYIDGDNNWVASSFVSPSFTIFPQQRVLDAWEWPAGEVITATLDGRPECTARGTAGYRADNPLSTFVQIAFTNRCRLAAGETLALTDGKVRIQHVIQDLAVTQVDENADTVAGISDTGAAVDAWVHGHHDETRMRRVARDGTWLADFGSAGFDITGGMCGRSEIRDVAGNSTAVDWCLPVP